MLHSYFGNKPELTVYDSQILAGDNGSGQSAVFNAAENTLTITLANTTGLTANSKIRIAGKFTTAERAERKDKAKFQFVKDAVTIINRLNGKKFKIKMEEIS